MCAGLPDGYSQIFRSYVFDPSGFWTMLRYDALQNLIPFFPWIAPPGRDQILPSGNLEWGQEKEGRAEGIIEERRERRVSRGVTKRTE